MNSDGSKPDEDMMEKAKQLLLLTDLVEKYPQVVSRRVSGLVYVLIAGGISFATLIFMFLQNIVGTGNPLLINVGFVLLSLIFSWAIGFRLIVPLTRSYQKETTRSSGELIIYAIWAVLGTAIVILSIATFQMGYPDLFAPGLQVIMGCGFAVNYILGRRQTGTFEFFTREQLYFSIVVLLSTIPMLLFPIWSYLILVVVNMGGIYVIGIWMLITAERLLLESKRQG